MLAASTISKFFVLFIIALTTSNICFCAGERGVDEWAEGIKMRRSMGASRILAYGLFVPRNNTLVSDEEKSRRNLDNASQTLTSFIFWISLQNTTFISGTFGFLRASMEKLSHRHAAKNWSCKKFGLE